MEVEIGGEMVNGSIEAQEYLSEVSVYPQLKKALKVRKNAVHNLLNPRDTNSGGCGYWSVIAYIMNPPQKSHKKRYSITASIIIAKAR